MSTHANAAEGPYKVNSLLLTDGVSAEHGIIKWDTKRSLWNAFMMLSATLLAPMHFSWSAFSVFFILSAITLCAGHSVGFHRRLIHRSFKCQKWVEYVLVWMGTAVGIGGPLWTIKTHDTRDWAQRQPKCHNFLAHRQGMLKDAWYNLHCRIELTNPPRFDPGAEIMNDKFYRFLERYWMWQQLPIVIALYFAGGFAWVVWGVFVRVTACTTMHWYISYFAHTQGPQSWVVDGAGVQAHDVPLAALPTMGESWHNNHHAFPASAKHGLYPGQIDIGWHFIQLLEILGLAWEIQTPEKLPRRDCIVPVIEEAETIFNPVKQKIWTK